MLSSKEQQIPTRTHTQYSSCGPKKLLQLFCLKTHASCTHLKQFSIYRHVSESKLEEYEHPLPSWTAWSQPDLRYKDRPMRHLLSWSSQPWWNYSENAAKEKLSRGRTLESAAATRLILLVKEKKSCSVWSSFCSLPPEKKINLGLSYCHHFYSVPSDLRWNSRGFTHFSCNRCSSHLFLVIKLTS